MSLRIVSSLQSQLKWGRNYSLSVDNATTIPVIIQPPFTIEFDIQRDVFSSNNLATIKIYNINPVTRASIFKDQSIPNLTKKVTLNAGYGVSIPNLPQIFSGRLMMCGSARNGTSVITNIEAQDAANATAHSIYNDTVNPNTPIVTLVNRIVRTMYSYGVTPGVFGNSITGVTQLGKSYAGNTRDILNQLLGNKWFIDGGVFNVLADSECLPDNILVIQDLLQTPIRQGGNVLNIETLFQPAVKVGQMIFLKSSTAQNFNNTYKCISVNHRGTISPVTCGDAITTLGLRYDPFLKQVSI